MSFLVRIRWAIGRAAIERLESFRFFAHWSVMKDFVPDSSLVHSVAPSPNIDERVGGDPDIILLHYTGMQTAEAALDRLRDTEARVSCHYFVHENGDIVQLVQEARRAWHAGVSSWGGETDINSRSIGIEIVNPGHEFGYTDFPIRQIAAVIALCRGIIARRAISNDRILAHSDVAPARKQDPGEKFPWKLLAESGVGLWVEPVSITDWLSLVPGDTGDTVMDLQKSLAEYGYGIPPSGEYDETTKLVVTAFQRHFRPAQVDGMADTSTRETLRRLLDARKALPRMIARSRS
jgi:N-acetylmuramoyl-L-alanine amidase